MAAGDSEMHAALSEFAPDWTEVVAIVSAHGNEVTSVRAGPDSDTPLHSACYWGALDAITVLLSAGADANAKNDAGATPLHLCALNHQPGAARLLLASGARVNEPEASDAAFTPLHTACSVGDAVTAGVLVEMGADPVSPLLGNGNTPLHVAAREGFNDVVELLAKACPKSVGVRNVAQETAIHRAAAHGQEDICASLVELGADVRAVDGNGDSALHLAAMFGMTQVRLLLHYKFDSFIGFCC